MHVPCEKQSRKILATMTTDFNIVSMALIFKVEELKGRIGPAKKSLLLVLVVDLIL